MKKGFIYYGQLDKKSLETLIENFFNNEETYQLIQNIDLYEPREKLPIEITKKGQTFSDKGEIRWEEKGEELFSVLILSESEITDISVELTPLTGNWMIEKKDLYLIPTNTSYISPNFQYYPKQVNNTIPKLTTSFYYKDNIAIFLSPRRFTNENL